MKRTLLAILFAGSTLVTGCVAAEDDDAARSLDDEAAVDEATDAEDLARGLDVPDPVIEEDGVDVGDLISEFANRAALELSAEPVAEPDGPLPDSIARCLTQLPNTCGRIARPSLRLRATR
ncbi:MAG: hypothetical protein R2939_10835 [Kofleriaceae bacterium]